MSKNIRESRNSSSQSRREFITRTVFAVGAAVLPTLVTSTPAALAAPKQDVRPSSENPEASQSPKPFPDASPSSITIQPSSSPIVIQMSPSTSRPAASQAPTRVRSRETIQRNDEISPQKKAPKGYDFF